MNDFAFFSFLILFLAVYAFLMLIFPFFSKIFLCLFLVFVLFCIHSMQMRLNIAYNIYDTVSHLRNYKYFNQRIRRALEDDFKRSKSLKMYFLYRIFVLQLTTSPIYIESFSNTNLYIRRILISQIVQVSFS